MKFTPPAAREFHSDASLRSRSVTEKHVAELRELHNEVAAAAEALTRWRAGSSRRRLRDARTAEADFLHALGFPDWAAFEDYLRRHPELALAADDVGFDDVDIDLVAEHAADESDGFRAVDLAPIAPAGDAEHLAALLAETRAHVAALHGSVAELNEQLERVLIETVALRLELMVAQRHRVEGAVEHQAQRSS